jgi:hypothetical protein
MGPDWGYFMLVRPWPWNRRFFGGLIEAHITAQFRYFKAVSTTFNP